MADRPSERSDASSGAHHLDLPHAFGDLEEVEHHVATRFRQKRQERQSRQASSDDLTLGQRIADTVAETMGSWRFIIIQSIVLAIWVVTNVIGFVDRWDPYPFILLNLMLSFQAAYAAPIIMMSQNRQEARDRARAELDLETDLKAETLIEEVHVHMLDLRLRRWAELLEIQQRQIEMLSDLVTRAERASDPDNSPSASTQSAGDRGTSLDL